jgi:hypothetical protein
MALMRTANDAKMKNENWSSNSPYSAEANHHSWHPQRTCIVLRSSMNIQVHHHKLCGVATAIAGGAI